MSTQKAHDETLWVETPLIRSTHLSTLLRCNVYLKLETFQPAQSFKCRGVSHFAQHALRTHGPDVHLMIASSGNAGLAAAHAANALGLRCTVFLPRGISQANIDTIRRAGAEVVTEGDYYVQALQLARKTVQETPNAIMVPGYDNPVLWEGHASMVHEIQRQLPPGVKPNAVICSFGGGGLAGGIIEGCKAVGWDDVPLVTAETHGSSCFYQTLSLNEGPFAGDVASRPAREGTTATWNAEHEVTVAHLAHLTSRASSLGASSSSPAVVRKALDRTGAVRSVCVTDEMTMQAAVNFAEDHKVLVELACAATLACAYNPNVLRKVVPEVTTTEDSTIVLIVCGGFKITLAEMEEYRRDIAADVATGGEWEVAYNGEMFTTPKIA
ncbi:tryptophan synthase beta subunit-like PLP-dependent enzyme [Trametes meyenii]|nr:tryptophan synthase beta subunit-like PLP-dependent enzyme [Trametes meyenii]